MNSFCIGIPIKNVFHLLDFWGFLFQLVKYNNDGKQKNAEHL